MTFPVCGRCLKPIMTLGCALTIGQVCECQQQSRTVFVWTSYDPVTKTGYGELKRIEPAHVPDAFQKAFSDGELEP